VRFAVLREFGRPGLLILVLGFLAGCFLLPSDGVVDVEGIIVASEGRPIEKCTLTLYSDTTGRVVGRQKVGQQVRADFVVAPQKATYHAELSCPGYPMIYRSPAFESNARYDDDPIQLGEISLVRPN